MQSRKVFRKGLRLHGCPFASKSCFSSLPCSAEAISEHPLSGFQLAQVVVERPGQLVKNCHIPEALLKSSQSLMQGLKPPAHLPFQSQRELRGVLHFAHTRCSRA